MAMYSDAQILAMLDSCDFDFLTPDNFHYQIPDGINLNVKGMKNVKKNIYYASGASKGVIWWPHKNWVIKIPFVASGEGQRYNSMTQQTGSYTRSNGEHISAHWVNRYNEGQGYEFENAGNSENDWDYCQTELENYRAACEANVGQFFAVTRLIGHVHGYPIYMQKRVETMSIYEYREVAETDTPEIQEIAENISGQSYGHIDWWAIYAAIKEQGTEAAIKLVNFLYDFKIGDLHSGNMGRQKGKFMIFDYSGYCED